MVGQPATHPSQCTTIVKYSQRERERERLISSLLYMYSIHSCESYGACCLPCSFVLVFPFQIVCIEMEKSHAIWNRKCCMNTRGYLYDRVLFNPNCYPIQSNTIPMSKSTDPSLYFFAFMYYIYIYIYTLYQKRSRFTRYL